MTPYLVIALGNPSLCHLLRVRLEAGSLSSPTPHRQHPRSASAVPLGSGGTNGFLDGWVQRKPFLIPPTPPSPPGFSLEWGGGF